ncbi:MAG: hypothetical protein JXA13_15540 [Anaerolineales bacterium]|nr:hypothetical protein [Anaerolineales bacterium]
MLILVPGAFSFPGGTLQLCRLAALDVEQVLHSEIEFKAAGLKNVRLKTDKKQATYSKKAAYARTKGGLSMHHTWVTYGA